MYWRKQYYRKWLYSSTRQQMTIEQQWCWLMLLDLAASLPLRDGTIRMGEGVPLSHEQIVNLIGGNLDILLTTIAFCQLDQNKTDERHRIEVWPDGTIEITNFKFFQSNPQDASEKKTKAIRHRQDALKSDVLEVKERVTLIEEVIVDNIKGNHDSPDAARRKRGIVQAEPGVERGGKT